MLTRTAVALLAITVLAGCSGITKLTDSIVQPSARDVYKREFKENKELFADWESEFRGAADNGLLIDLPYKETGSFNPINNSIYSYRFKAEAGEKINIAINKSLADVRVFADLFDGARIIATADPIASSLEFEVAQTGYYSLIIQPEIRANAKFAILVNKNPSYGFPVAGKGNSAIQSFWGAVRDGGKRRHEGVDIFAKRGTPVVAVTDGIVSFTGNQGLGGKQVWLREGIFGNSIYYAHLDGIAVSSGQRVKAGEVLGYVGNTGNAKGGAPHLHFGIYRAGAVDPLPYIYQPKQISFKGFGLKHPSLVKIKSRKANIRVSPENDAGILRTLTSTDPLICLGKSNDWLHIQTPDKQRGYVHQSVVREIY